MRIEPFPNSGAVIYEKDIRYCLHNRIHYDWVITEDIRGGSYAEGRLSPRSVVRPLLDTVPNSSPCVYIADDFSESVYTLHYQFAVESGSRLLPYTGRTPQFVTTQEWVTDASRIASHNPAGHYSKPWPSSSVEGCFEWLLCEESDLLPATQCSDSSMLLLKDCRQYLENYSPVRVVGSDASKRELAELARLCRRIVGLGEEALARRMVQLETSTHRTPEST